MTRFAVAAPVWKGAVEAPWSSEASAGMPIPVAARPKKCRRVHSVPCMRLLLRNRLVEVQNRTRDHRPCRQFRRCDCVPGTGFPIREQLPGFRLRLAEVFELLSCQTCQFRSFAGAI